MVTSPLVSVVIPTYNRPEMLAEALASVSAQTYRHVEIVVVNDAGQDVSAVLERFGDLAITHVRHEVNRGLAAARNTGISRARGALLAFLDDDDIFYPHHLARLVAAMEADLGRMVVYSDGVQAYQRQLNGHWEVEKRLLRHSIAFSRRRLLVDNHLAVLCVLARKEVFEAVGGFDESLRVYEDWDMWLRTSRRFAFVHVPEVTCEYRLRSSDERMSVKESNQFLPLRFRLWARHSFLPLTLVLACVHFARRALYRLRVPQAEREAGMVAAAERACSRPSG